MAKNWSAAEAAQVVFEGKDKAAIQDIGRRFPLFVSAAARGAEGLLEIIGCLHPERVTARTIEAKMKESVEESDDVEEEEVQEKPAKKEKAPKGGKGKGKKAAKEEEDEEEEEKPAKKEKAGKKGKGKKDPEPVEEDEDWDDEEEDEDGDGYEDMSLAQLKKEAKKQKISVKGLDKDGIIAALRGEEPEDDDDEDEEDEDDDWDL